MANQEKKTSSRTPPAAGRRRQGAAPSTRVSGKGPADRSRTGLETGAKVAIGAVLAVVVLMVVIFVTGGGNDDAGGEDVAAASVAKVTTVPSATLESVGMPSAPRNVNVLPAGTAPVEEDGKPLVLYYGAEYCPFCAVQRWPAVVALSRFGTFQGLAATTSAPPPEVLPNTPTVTFHGATYTSDYITLSAVETATRDFTPLDSPTDRQQQLFATYNVDTITGSNGGIPFMMIGNLYAWAGSQYDPSVLEGKTFDEIADELADPTTDVARSIGGAANYLTAMICRVTGGQPEGVCATATIQQAQAALPTP